MPTPEPERKNRTEIYIRLPGVIPPGKLIAEFQVLTQQFPAQKENLLLMKEAFLSGCVQLAILVERGGFISKDGRKIITLPDPEFPFPKPTFPCVEIKPDFRRNLGYRLRTTSTIEEKPIFLQIVNGNTILAGHIRDAFEQHMGQQFQAKCVGYPRLSASTAANQFLFEVANRHGKGNIDSPKRI